MAQQTINIGAVANDSTGDTPRVAGAKINANFTELYAADAASSGALTSAVSTLNAADSALSTRITALESTLPSAVFSYQAGTAITVTVAALNTFYAIPGVAIFTLSDAVGFVSGNNGTSQYLEKTVTGAQTYLISGFICLTKTAGGTNQVEARIAKNGTALTTLGAVTKNADYDTLPLTAIVSLAATDKISVMVKNIDAAANIDINRCYVAAQRI